MRSLGTNEEKKIPLLKKLERGKLFKCPNQKFKFE